MLEWDSVVKDRTAPLGFRAESTKHMCIGSAYGNGCFVYIQLSSMNKDFVSVFLER